MASFVALVVPTSASAINTVTFSPAGSMAVPREYPGAARLPDGRVLVVGGGNNAGAEASTEIYDPATGAFSPGPTMLRKQYGPATVTLADGRVLIAGGGVEPNVTFAEIFDPKTGTFSPTPGLMTQARYDATGALLPDGRVLIAGGYHMGQLNTA